MIEKLPHPTDGRSRVLVLNARGEATRREIFIALAAVSPLGVLPPDDQEQLLDLLCRVAE